MTKTQRLGKGLSALLNTQINCDPDSELKYVNINCIFPNTEQPRKIFDLEKLIELSDSIKKHGIIEPLVLLKSEEQKYIIISGERRWRAAKLANIIEVPAIIKDTNKIIAFEMSLVENIQRQDLTLIEEAEGYAKLINDYGYTQDDISKIIGKSRSHIANVLRLNTLPQSIKDKLSSGQISMGHAKILVGLENAEEIVEIIVAKSLNVRQTEQMVSQIKCHLSEKKPIVEVLDIVSLKELHDIKEMMEQTLGVNVKIDSKSNKGKIILYFHNMLELDKIVSKLT